MGLFTDLFSTKPAENAAAAKVAGYNNGLATSDAALTAGQTNADRLYGEAGVPLGATMTRNAQGADTYADATGAHGAEGIARSGSLYKLMPGYNGGLMTGTDQLMRTAAARGDLGGGNTSADVIRFASDYDAGKYGNFVNALNPYVGADLSSTSANTALKTGQAALDMGVAGQKAGTGFQAAVGAGNANADKELAPYSASSNFWGSLMGLGNMALKASGVGGYAPTVKPAAA